MSETTLVQAEQLKNYCALLFQKLGVPQEEALLNADSLIEADLTGVESHGVSRVPLYLKRLRLGLVRPSLELKTIIDMPSTAVIDACNSLGVSVSTKAMGTVIEKAKQNGIAFVTVKNSNHYGTAAYFAKMALEHNMIGFTGTNVPPCMAPWGGTVPYFGTNPIAVAIPAGKQLPIVVDMATSVVARGKIALAAKKNQPIPLGWARTIDGEDTTDAKAALEGALLPFAGPKGSAIATIIEVFSGILAGSIFTSQLVNFNTIFEGPAKVSHFFGAIDIKAFVAIEQFKDNIDQMVTEVKANPPAKGVNEIFLPGEIEWRSREKRLHEGIPLSPVIINELKNEGQIYGVDWSEVFDS